MSADASSASVITLATSTRSRFEFLPVSAGTLIKSLFWGAFYLGTAARFDSDERAWTNSILFFAALSEPSSQ